eukprot:RCo049409
MAEAASRDVAEVRGLSFVDDVQLEGLVANIRLSSGRDYCVVLDENYPKGEPVMLDGTFLPRGSLAKIATRLHESECSMGDESEAGSEDSVKAHSEDCRPASPVSATQFPALVFRNARALRE